MKKLVSLLLALILLVSAVPALAASLTPEDVIGTWEMYYLANDDRVTTAAMMKKYGICIQYKYSADGTGCTYERFATGTVKKRPYTWAIEGNKVRMSFETGGYLLLKKNGKELQIKEQYNDGLVIVEKYKRIKDYTDKTVKKAILSSGTYKLNNSKKTAVFTAPSPFIKGGTSLKIPDTITVQGKTYKVIEIAANACANDMLLTTLTVGKNMKVISANAFSGCANLRKITFKGAALGKVKSNAFAGTKDNAVVTCPKAKLARYTKLLQKAGLSQTARFKAK